MRCISLLVLLHFCFCIQAQETREVVRSRFSDEIERFYVLSSNDTIREGHYSYSYKGVLLHEGDYKNGERTGPWKFYDYQSKKQAYTYDYSAKQFTGEYNRYENGLLRSTCNYVSGKRQGKHIAYDTDGAPELEQYFSNDSLDGVQKYYYEPGKPSSEKSYVRGKLNGTSTDYWKNGNVKSKIEYQSGNLMNVLLLNDSSGSAQGPGTIKDGNGTLRTYYDNGKLKSVDEYVLSKKNGRYSEYRPDGSMFISGHLKEETKTGTWTFFLADGTERCAYDFDRDSMLRQNDIAEKMMSHTENDRIRRIIRTSNRPLRSPVNEEDAVYQVVEQESSFPGGPDDLMRFLRYNMHYPDSCKKAGKQGMVVIGFVVNKQGFIQDIKVLKSADPLLDKEALRVAGLMPRWQPGLMLGKPVNSHSAVPIRFKLD